MQELLARLVLFNPPLQKSIPGVWGADHVIFKCLAVAFGPEKFAAGFENGAVLGSNRATFQAWHLFCMRGFVSGQQYALNWNTD